MNKTFLSMCQRLSHSYPKRMVSRLGALESNLAKASLRIPFQAYLGLMLFASVVSGIAAFSVALLLSSAPLLSVPIGLLIGLAAFGVCYAYPMLGISSKARKIEANLPLTANFMAVLASAGMPPERIFRSLANVGDEFGVGIEVRRIIGDIEVLGLDLNVALKNGSARSASKKFASMLDGVVTTVHVGEICRVISGRKRRSTRRRGFLR